MIKKQWENIEKNQDVRQSLSKIRQELKKDGSANEFSKIIEGKEQQLIQLLQSEDAKTRKNAVLLMGDLGKQEFLEPIYQAYQEESQRFVKSSYLSAIGNFDYRSYLDDFNERLESLNKIETTLENEKHLREEMRELSALIVRMEGVTRHKFIGWDEPYELILLTNRNFAKVTGDELKLLDPDAKMKEVGVGVKTKVTNLRWLEHIRTYQDALFIIEGMQTCPMEPDQVAEMVANSDLLSLLSKNHDGEPPFYFRVELKSKRQLDEKSSFVKKLSSLIEKKTERKLINTTNNYEIELRVIENKEGNVNILVKLFTIKDQRFSYRKEVIPTSIRPVNAALTVALAKDYLKENAQVLDPFCGVGTMLIERHMAVNTNTKYGLDIQEDAILKARRNTEAAGQIAHYINRDFFSFQHDYLFDEVITNMPFQIGRTSEDEIYELYQLFFEKLGEYLKDGAKVILYTHNKEYIKHMAPENEFEILKEFEISRKEGTYVFILEYK